MIKIASIQNLSQTFEDGDVATLSKVQSLLEIPVSSIGDDAVLCTHQFNVLWFSIALLPSSTLIGLYLSQTLLYSQTQWNTLQRFPMAYCEIFTTLTSFIVTLMSLFFTRKILQHYVMQRAYKPFKSLRITSQQKATREVTEIIARGWTLALCIPSLTLLSMENGLEAPYFTCNKSNISELVKLQC